MNVKMETVDASWYWIFHASKWRERFLESAGNAAQRVAEYSRNIRDYENAARWEKRARSIRDYAMRSTGRE